MPPPPPVMAAATMRHRPLGPSHTMPLISCRAAPQPPRLGAHVLRQHAVGGGRGPGVRSPEYAATIASKHPAPLSPNGGKRQTAGAGVDGHASGGRSKAREDCEDGGGRVTNDVGTKFTRRGRVKTFGAHLEQEKRQRISRNTERIQGECQSSPGSCSKPRATRMPESS